MKTDIAGPTKSKVKGPKFSLLTIVLLVGLGGSILGMSLRHYFGGVQYQWLSRNCDGYLVEGMWQTQAMKDDKLLYLLAWPRGPKASGVVSRWNRKDGRFGRGIGRYPAGLFVEGSPVDVRDDKRVWVYCWEEGSGSYLQCVDLSDTEIESLQRSEFVSLERADAWPAIRDVLDNQSKKNKRYWEARRNQALPAKQPRRWN